MLALSKSSRTSFLFVIFVFLLNTFHEIKSQIIDPLDKYHSNSEVHGLYEIRQAARNFIENENKNNSIKYEVLEPNLKIQVSLCLVPLITKWSNTDSPIKSVDVSCRKTVNNTYEKKWHVLVPVALKKYYFS